MSFLDILGGIFEGFHITAAVTFYGLAYAVPFAFVFGILQHFTTGPARFAVTSVIEFWRSSPTIILLFVFYYSLPSFGVTLSAMTVAAMALGLNIGGYGSQAVRAALQSLDRGQVDAGWALGLRRRQILASIELPQAIVAMTPTFINQIIQLIKGTALVSLITLGDMTFRAREIVQIDFRPDVIFSVLLLAYFLVCYPVTILGRWAEKRVGQGREAHREL